MNPKPILAAERHIRAPERALDPDPTEWDGRCPECGGDTELTSYLGTDDMRSEEHWWCAKCMLALNVRVVRMVARATSVKRDE